MTFYQRLVSYSLFEIVNQNTLHYHICSEVRKIAPWRANKECSEEAVHPRGRIKVFSVLSRAVDVFITKTRLYNFDPLKPHFYIVKLGFIGVYIIFLILLQDIECGCSLEPPRRGGPNKHPQSMLWAEILKINFFNWNFPFLVVKFSMYLNRRVYIMISERRWAG